MPDVVVAGGAGGLGQAAVRMLAREWRVVASYRSNEKAAAEIADVATLVRADLRSAEDRAALLDAAPELYGLVVYAGVSVRVSSPDELEAAMVRSHDMNFLGPVLLAREAAERMRRSGVHGSIVLISTMQAVSVFPNSTAYAAQKAALVHAARVLAKECRGPADIRVNVVCPGVIEAGMALTTIAMGKYDRYRDEGSVPRWGRPEDVARAVRLFLEPDSYITGQVLTVDGGLTL